MKKLVLAFAFLIPAGVQAQGTLAIRHLQKICGDPPPEMELEIVWQEHDLGTYPTIALTWEDGMRGAPWPYISRCQTALAAYEDGEEPPHRSAPCDFDGDSTEFQGLLRLPRSGY